jgi:hypothetical protein
MSIFRVFDGMFRIVMGLIVMGWIAFMVYAQSEYHYYTKLADEAHDTAVRSTANNTAAELAVDPYAVPDESLSSQNDPYVARPDDVQGDDYSAPADDWGE